MIGLDFRDYERGVKSQMDVIHQKIERNASQEVVLDALENLSIHLEELIEENRKALKLADVAPFGMMYIERDGTLSYINPKFTELFGYDIGDVSNGNQWFLKAFHEGICKDEKYGNGKSGRNAMAPWLEGLKSCSQGKLACTFKVVCKDGLVKTARFFATPREDGVSLVFCQDVTAHESTDEALRSSLDFNGVLMDAIPSPVFYKDRNGIFRGCNKIFAEQFIGISREQVIGHQLCDFHDYLSRNLSGIFSRQDGDLLRTGRAQIYEAEVRCSDGISRTFRFNKAASKDHGGNIAGIIGVVQDISDYRQIEDTLIDVKEEMHQARQQLFDIIDFLPDATFVVDKERCVISWNRAMEQLTGVSKSEILGKGDFAYGVPFYGKPRPILIDLIFAPDPEIERQYSSVERKGQTISANAAVPFLLQGHETYLWCTASPLFDEEGRVIGAIESIRDVTARKKAELALKESEASGVS